MLSNYLQNFKIRPGNSQVKEVQNRKKKKKNTDAQSL